MQGFRIGPLDATDQKNKKMVTYKVGHTDEGKTLANRLYKEETVFVKKVRTTCD